MKVIFLGVDGVLNTVDTEEKVNTIIYIDEFRVRILKENSEDNGG